MYVTSFDVNVSGHLRKYSRSPANPPAFNARICSICISSCCLPHVSLHDREPLSPQTPNVILPAPVFAIVGPLIQRHVDVLLTFLPSSTSCSRGHESYVRVPA